MAETARDRLRAAFEARHDHAASAGPGTIGCIGHAAPVEIVLAAGLTPLRLAGDPARAPGPGDTYMEEEADGEVRSVFDRMLRGEFAALDLILLPRDSEMRQQMHYYIAEVRNWEPEARVPEVRIVDVMQTAYHLTSRYVRARLDELAERLGAMGHAVTEDRLAEAIAATNATRAALQRLNEKRREGAVAGSDVLRAHALFGILPMAELAALCDAVCAEAEGTAQGPRLMISGSMQDDPGFFEVVEAAGAHIAADDHVGGERLSAHPVDEAMHPMEALTTHYQLHMPTLRQYPQAPQDARFLETCRAAGIDGHVCVLEDNDDTLGWDYPPRRKALEAISVPSLLLPGQSYFAPDRAAQKAAISAFLETLKAPA